jgi:UDP-N-acetylglucosamine:LPS N-acetylglucosamine transferase
MNDHRGASITTGDTSVGQPSGPRRVLVVSADMGGGHHATATALEESVQRNWPGSEIRRIDALDVMGGWVGDAFRRTYVSNVESTPWLYEFFYSSLWRHRWFAGASKRFVGSWCGRRLVRHIDAFDPDLVLSTYPLGTAGLDWLIRHRALSVPVASWVSDFAPHPFWVYRDIAANYLVHRAALPGARCAEPGGRYRISNLPVSSRFGGQDRAEARAELGLRPDALVVLIGCGSYAFGDVVSLVRTVAEVSDRIQVVAACGRNERTRDRIVGLGFDRGRIEPLGWTDRMPTVTAAADIVIGNAGGATALEAMVCGVPLVLTEPIAAHGAANAELMAVAGSAELCTDRAALRAYLATAVRDRESDPGGPASNGAVRVAATAADEPTLDHDLVRAAGSANAGRPRRYAGWPMRAADAFFQHVETTGATQELGVVLELAGRPDASMPTLADIHAALQQRTALPSLRRILLRGRPGWRLAAGVDVADHIDETVLATDDPAALWDAAGDLFAERLPAGRPAWRMRLVRHHGRGALFAIKMHHCQADGISALGLLDRLLDPAGDDPLPERRPLPDTTGSRSGIADTARGLWSLAGRGFAPHHRLGDEPLAPGRLLVAGSLPWSAVRSLARSAGASVTETSVAIGAHVLHRLLAPAGLLTDGAPLRTMVPVAMRPARLDREFGTWTGSLAADLDMAERPIVERTALVRDELRRRQHAQEAPAAAAAMSIAGRLPIPVHRLFTRAVYQPRFFSTVVSFMPGARRARWLAGAPVTGMAPVLPLPPRVPVTVGMIVTAGRLDLGITTDGRPALSRPAVRAAVDAVLAEVGAVPAGGAP